MWREIKAKQKFKNESTADIYIPEPVNTKYISLYYRNTKCIIIKMYNLYTFKSFLRIG